MCVFRGDSEAGVNTAAGKECEARVNIAARESSKARVIQESEKRSCKKGRAG